jgi:hypothetical protein
MVSERRIGERTAAGSAAFALCRNHQAMDVVDLE